MATIDNRVEADPGVSDYARRVASRMARLAACTSTYTAGHGSAPGDPPPVEDVVLGDPDVHRPIMAKGFAHGSHFASPAAAADDLDGGAVWLGMPERDRGNPYGIHSMSSTTRRPTRPDGVMALQDGKPRRRPSSVMPGSTVNSLPPYARPKLPETDAPRRTRLPQYARPPVQATDAQRRNRQTLSDLRPGLRPRGPQFDTKNEGWNGHVVGGLSGTQGVGAGVGTGFWDDFKDGLKRVRAVGMHALGGGVGGDLPGPAPGEGAAAVNELPALPAEPRSRRNPDREHVMMAEWGAPLDYWRPKGSQQKMEAIVEHGEPPENLTIRYNFYDGELPVEPIAAMAGKTGSKRKRVVK